MAGTEDATADAGAARPTSARWSRRVAALLLGGLLAALLAEAGLHLHAGLILDGATDRGGMDGQLTEHHPVLGWLGKPGAQVRHRTTEFDVTYRIDERGFRALPDDVTAPRDGRPRVALLGDSFLFGQGVAEEARLSVRLSRALDVEVTELALPATGTGQHVLFYEQPGRHHGADWVVLGFLPEHIERLAAERWAGRAKPRWRLDQEASREWTHAVCGYSLGIEHDAVEPPALSLPHAPLPTRVQSLDERAAADDLGPLGAAKRALQRHSLLYALARKHLRAPLRALLQRTPDDPHPTLVAQHDDWWLLAALIDRLERAVRADGGQLAVAFLPERWHASHADDRRHQRALRTLLPLHIPLIDLGATLDDASDGAPSAVSLPTHAVDGHWTTAGHALAARQLVAGLRRAGLQPPN